MGMDRVRNPSLYKRAMLPAVSVQHECDTTQHGHMFIMCRSHVPHVSITYSLCVNHTVIIFVYAGTHRTIHSSPFVPAPCVTFMYVGMDNNNLYFACHVHLYVQCMEYVLLCGHFMYTYFSV